MLRKLSFIVAILLLVPALAIAAPAKKKRKPAGNYSSAYGFLPGYLPADVASGAVRFKRLRRPPYGYYGRRPYNYYGPYQEYVGWGPYLYPTRTMWSFGGPGFYDNRYNGGGLGPCYTRTPIGPVWNCGK